MHIMIELDFRQREPDTATKHPALLTKTQRIKSPWTVSSFVFANYPRTQGHTHSLTNEERKKPFFSERTELNKKHIIKITSFMSQESLNNLYFCK